MAKKSFSALTSGFQAVDALNTNFDDLESILQSQVLYRNNPTGEPNGMANDLDMNGYNLLNVGNIGSLTTLTGVAIYSWGNQRDGTGTHSLSTGDIYSITEISASSSVTACISISTEATGGWTSGKWCRLLQKGAGPIKAVADVGVTLRAKGSVRTNIQYGIMELYYRGSDIWYVAGDLSAS